MADNVLETVQKLVQDVIAPDVRELKVRLESFEKQVDDRFKAIEERLEAMMQINANQFERVLSTINEAKALGEIAALREMAPLRERIAVLEVQARSAA